MYDLYTRNSLHKSSTVFPDVDLNIKKAMLSKYKLNASFVLSSGRSTDHYFDIKSLLLDNTDWSIIKDILIKDLKSKFPGVVYVAGSGVGGILFAMRIASCLEFNISPIIVRDSMKTYGLLKQVEGKYFHGSPRTVIVDDVVTTGNSFIKVKKILRGVGIKVLGNYAFLKRKESNFKCESFISEW